MAKQVTAKKQLKGKGHKQHHIVPPIKEDIKTRNKKIAYLSIIITIFSFLLYAQSIKHNYTLDDHKVIDQNSVTTSGIAGIPTILKTDYWFGSNHDELRGPIYRPAPMLIWAIGWEISPDNPQLYHFFNVLFYAISCLLLFLVLCQLFSQQSLFLPLICTFLYAAHPIHTEVVNNIKSLDEILCFLFGIASMWALVKYVSTRSGFLLIAAGFFYFLSLLSKETGVTFLVILPLTVFFFSDLKKRSLWRISILLVSITAIWLLIRMFVFKDLIRNIVTETSALNNTLYAAPDVLSKYATAFYILLRYIGLLIFPHPLTCDYNYAQIKIQTFSDPAPAVGFLVYAALGIYSLINIPKKSPIAYGILFYLVTLAPVSNIFFLGGSSMAERFLFIPSLGFCLVISYLLAKYSNNYTALNFKGHFLPKRAVVAMLVVIGLLYSIKTYTRSKDWKDTLTVFSKDVEVSQNSATANELLGNSLVLRTSLISNKQHKQDTLNLAKKYLKRALEIAPGFYYASSNLGYIYLTENKPDSAYLYLKPALKFGPQDVQLSYYTGSSLFLLKRYDEAIQELQHTVSLNPRYEDAYVMLANSYISNRDLQNGLAAFYKVLEINPGNAKAYYNAAGILASMGNMAKADDFMNKAKALGYKP